MKNILKKVFLASFVAALAFSCSEEENPENYTGELGVYFSDDTYGSIQVFEAGAIIQDGIPVTLIGKASNTDVSVTVSVDDSSTAVAGTHFNLPSTTVTIPAGEYSVEVPFEVILDGFTGPEDQRTLVLNLASSTAAAIAENNATVTATLGYVCPSELLVTTNYEIIATNNPDLNGLVGNTGTLEWTGGTIGDNGTEYIWDTYTFGAYQTLYACCEREGAGTVLFINDFCDDISIAELDDFGCVWDLTVVEVAGPSITFDVFSDCMGTLRIVMTRQDGADWPNLS